MTRWVDNRRVGIVVAVGLLILAAFLAPLPVLASTPQSRSIELGAMLTENQSDPMETTIIKTEVKPRRMSIVQLLTFGLVVGLLAIFAVGIVNRSAKPVESGAAPPFTIPLYGGGDFSLAEQRGQVVVVNFWASWCVPCREEAPMLERVWKKYKDRGVVFIGVDYVDTESEALKFLKEFGSTYPNGPDMGTETSHRYRIQGVPEMYFIAKDGTLVGNRIGPVDESAFVAKIEELLKK